MFPATIELLVSNSEVFPRFTDRVNAFAELNYLSHIYLAPRVHNRSKKETNGSVLLSHLALILNLHNVLFTLCSFVYSE